MIQAHGLGGVRDLPLPLNLTIFGAAAALAISFAVLGFAWRVNRYDPPTGGSDSPLTGRPAPAWLDRLVRSRGWRLSLRVFGLVTFAYLGLALVAGEDLSINPIFGAFFVWLWVGLVPASLLFGPVLKAMSPFRAVVEGLAKLGRFDPQQGVLGGVPGGVPGGVSGGVPGGVLGNSPAWGYWPAALGLTAFVWFELVGFAANPSLASLQLWIALWIGAVLIGGLLWGTDFIAHAEPFEVYSSLVAKLSPWAYSSESDQLRLRSPLANLASLPPERGLVAVVAVLFGSTAFDSFRESLVWVRLVQEQGWPAQFANSLALLALMTGVGVLFSIGSAWTGGNTGSRRHLPAQFAHSIVPIIVGYIVAHYLTYFINVGQETLVYLSDPLSIGANWLGTGNYVPNNWLTFHPQLIAVSKVTAVVLGHLLGVVAAHDRALTLLPKRARLTGQLPLLLVMVGFTVGGLFLLFAA